MDALATVALLATFNMAVVDYLAEPLKQQAWFARFTWTLLYVAFVTGFLLAYLAGVNVIPSIAPAMTDPIVGRVMTAALVGGGSKLLHDVIDKPASA